MSGKAFLDTNILIYLYSDSENEKMDAAYRAVDTHDCVTSTQALNEACNVWLKKFGWNGSIIKEHLDNIELVCDEVAYVQKNTIFNALTIQERYGYTYYDCLMLSSALEYNCDIILTEDMADGQVINDRLTIVNPLKK